MCDLADDMCDVWDGRWIRARKERPCMACSMKIVPGSVYHRQDSLYDGSWTRWSHCARCWKIVERLIADSDEPIAIDPNLNCGEIWDDPPEDIAALAFMLPAEIAAEAERMKCPES